VASDDGVTLAAGGALALPPESVAVLRRR
ncbi:MAG: hypothetical protein QOI56_2004, partial [Actinomycetota bacterium]|nr:hypothetical protein [Actinomycetota bacterium]